MPFFKRRSMRRYARLTVQKGTGYHIRYSPTTNVGAGSRSFNEDILVAANNGDFDYPRRFKITNMKIQINDVTNGGLDQEIFTIFRVPYGTTSDDQTGSAAQLFGNPQHVLGSGVFNSVEGTRTYYIPSFWMNMGDIIRIYGQTTTGITANATLITAIITYNVQQ